MGTRILGERKEEDSRRRCRRILVVDDEASIRNILAAVLKLQGYEVLVAMNGADALEICTRDPGRIDVLITDLMMPLMGGQELMERTAVLRPEMRTICMSATLSTVSLGQSVLFMPKPFKLRAIVGVVQLALQGPRLRQAELG